MRFAFFGALMLFASLAFGEPACKGANSSVQALVECAQKNSPEIQDAELEVESAKAQVSSAGQWRNPELSAERTDGTLGNDRRSETDLSLGVPIELGGKISARTSVAEAQVAVAEAKLYGVRSKVRAEFLLKLHRLRQVLHEQEIIDEAIGTFSKLVGQYRRRPTLSPDQQLSASVFQMSKGDYDLKKSANLDEVLQLNTYFQVTTGLTADDLKGIAPKPPKTWPEMKAGNPSQISPQLKVLQAQVKGANAELSVARSESWPTLTVGPSMKMLKEGGLSTEMVGFNVSLPVPVFNLNGGAKSAASANVRLSEKRREFGEREQVAKRDELVRNYQQSVMALGTTLSHEEIERRHSDSEKLFARGIVPAPLVIEAHRSSFELEKSRHERELKALESLYGIYIIDGTNLEGKP